MPWPSWYISVVECIAVAHLIVEKNRGLLNGAMMRLADIRLDFHFVLLMTSYRMRPLISGGVSVGRV